MLQARFCTAHRRILLEIGPDDVQLQRIIRDTNSRFRFLRLKKCLICMRLITTKIQPSHDTPFVLSTHLFRDRRRIMRSNTRVGHYVFVVVVEDNIIVVVYDV